MNIYQFDATLEDGTHYSLEKEKGKVILIVNTASKCGHTPQFKELEALYEKYQDQGFVVLGFPSNEFHQELATGQEAAEACRLQYGVTFPMHTLTTLKGEQADPLFKFLQTQTTEELSGDIKWNFTKFLIARDGHFAARFAHRTAPFELIPTIEKLLEV
ncbi:MAG: glutathione peroxidase [Enterococcus lemanii]|jgi:glutathione peroxidase